MRVVNLLHALDPVHEQRELLELRPLVVRGADRDVDLDRLFYASHEPSSSSIEARRARTTPGETHSSPVIPTGRLWARLDSNQGATDYESAALTAELRARSP